MEDSHMTTLTKEKIKANILPFALSIALALGVGLLSALITKDSMDIYSEINVPPLSPPTWLFPVVWSVLYVLMGISAAIVYVKAADPEDLRKPMTYYLVSLALNFVWSIVFFNGRTFFAALCILLALLYFIVKTITEYFKISKPAALLQLPYALWVAFAGYLNVGIWLIN